MRTKVIEKNRSLAMGIDVDGRSVVIFVQDIETRQMVHECRILTSEENLLAYLARFPGCTIRACYESGFSGYWMARFLIAQGVDCRVVAPTDVPKEANAVKRKNDFTDARRLANVFNITNINFVRMPTEMEQAHRQLLRVREQTVHAKGRCQNQIKSMLMQHNLKYSGKSCWSRSYITWLKALAFPQAFDRISLDFKIAEYEQQCLHLKAITDCLHELSRSDQYRADVERLQTIKGVGWLTAMTWLLEIFRPEEYHDTRKISSHLGLIPGEFSSGGHSRMGHITHYGPSLVRKALGEAAWRWVSGDVHARCRYARIAERCGSRKKAIIAMARFLGTVFWAMCVKKEPYNPLKWSGVDLKKIAC